MLDRAFDRVYTKFKLHFYRAVFARFQNREASLTTVESFCMEIINALGHPTINEFSSFVNISPPNAAYKINNLIQKGYVTKRQSPDDKREYHLYVTQNISTTTMSATATSPPSWTASSSASPRRMWPSWRRCWTSSPMS